MRPAILIPAEAPNVYTAARLYMQLGFSILPCEGKKPALTHWKHLQTRAATAPTIDLWHKVGLLTNVGVICGRVSGNLVVIDLDGDEATWEFIDAFPHLLRTYTVRSGSGHGYHLYYYVDESTPTTRVTGLDIGNIELRSDGAYVVAPPSIHPMTGKLYAVSESADIMRVPTLRPVVEWIKSLIKQKHGGEMPPPANAKRTINSSAYGLVALRNEAAEVARASVGDRNHRLYRAALKMGSLIADGRLTAAEVERELLAAASALTKDDGEAATLRTIHSGIQTGMQSSREAWKKNA